MLCDFQRSKRTGSMCDPSENDQDRTGVFSNILKSFCATQGFSDCPTSSDIMAIWRYGERSTGHVVAISENYRVHFNLTLGLNGMSQSVCKTRMVQRDRVYWSWWFSKRFYSTFSCIIFALGIAKALEVIDWLCVGVFDRLLFWWGTGRGCRANSSL